jgi:hypothetical protein
MPENTRPRDALGLCYLGRQEHKGTRKIEIRRSIDLNALGYSLMKCAIDQSPAHLRGIASFVALA